jgi:hypothetical protein
VACVVDGAGVIRARFQLPSAGTGFSGLGRRLAKLGVDGVAIERPHDKDLHPVSCLPQAGHRSCPTTTSSTPGPAPSRPGEGAGPGRAAASNTWRWCPYERRADVLLGFVHLACALICLKQLPSAR